MNIHNMITMDESMQDVEQQRQSGVQTAIAQGIPEVEIGPDYVQGSLELDPDSAIEMQAILDEYETGMHVSDIF